MSAFQREGDLIFSHDGGAIQEEMDRTGFAHYKDGYWQIHRRSMKGRHNLSWSVECRKCMTKWLNYFNSADETKAFYVRHKTKCQGLSE